MILIKKKKKTEEREEEGQSRKKGKGREEVFNVPLFCARSCSKRFVYIRSLNSYYPSSGLNGSSLKDISGPNVLNL